ncbi:hypothetical protein DMB66_20435 [Actinoplanes sp. ATCC 53533]|uniref:hypothetical protein n=1 Tax=Actinoplanes sp. ATCC 53533 TaxID=1288362 RepID=UPI000F7A4325|nr:hypothetical protein [Actinoplanes sp. ATCC 53533]RSM64275.1 hypothetical protein DMB66_20435 [Actinoplanes sp. ATCC 53533]
MTGEISEAVSVERLLGGELAAAAERTLAEAQLNASDPTVVVQLATAQVLMALYWELRHRRPETPAVPPCTGDDPSLEWVSALLCSPHSPSA